MPETGNRADLIPISVAIPTLNRGEVLLKTIKLLLAQSPPPAQILVIDQTRIHRPEVGEQLKKLVSSGQIDVIKRSTASITGAMNQALFEARNEIVLFLDDDILPQPGLILAHAEGHHEKSAWIVAGRVLQPWDREDKSDAATEPGDNFSFASNRPQPVREFMGGNFSIRRSSALKLGGFDENFQRVALNFEREFAHRAHQAGIKIKFVPDACIHHLKTPRGGTRQWGRFLHTIKPDHSVGAYYCIFRTTTGLDLWLQILRRLRASLLNRYHLRQPWWFPASCIAETGGIIWAVFLAAKGPRLLVSDGVSVYFS